MQYKGKHPGLFLRLERLLSEMEMKSADITNVLNVVRKKLGYRKSSKTSSNTLKKTNKRIPLPPKVVEQLQSSLEELGFSTYFHYKRSLLWSQINTSIISHNPYCKICNGKSEVAHHLSYDTATMKGENLDNLIACCNKCHLHIHQELPELKEFLPKVV